MRYAVLIANHWRSSQGGNLEPPDLVRYDNLPDALIDWVCLPPSDAWVRGIYDDGAVITDPDTPFWYTCVQFEKHSIVATGWIAWALFGQEICQYVEGSPLTIKEIAAKLLAYQAGPQTYPLNENADEKT